MSTTTLKLILLQSKSIYGHNSCTKTKKVIYQQPSIIMKKSIDVLLTIHSRMSHLQFIIFFMYYCDFFSEWNMEWCAFSYSKTQAHTEKDNRDRDTKTQTERKRKFSSNRTEKKMNNRIDINGFLSFFLVIFFKGGESSGSVYVMVADDSWDEEVGGWVR